MQLPLDVHRQEVVGLPCLFTTLPSFTPSEEILRTTLLEVLGEVQVKDVELECTALRPISIFDFAPSVLEDRDSVAFAFKVSACDPNDLEPLRETLLLEAESGGARHLLPLLVQKLCDDDLPIPHLKVRMEVGEDP
ncbi:unnamed protein product [Symbiodinium natans]|uniref:Uncharacterized protein n=1 Tax=Symbiodinium natans TaxID=878477 RepID=A0A812UEN9_9DINO|nr:unnamed protein product [Symbiodinium natans]